MEEPHDEVRWLFVSSASVCIRIGDGSFDSENREIRAGSFLTVLVDLLSPLAMQVAPNDGNKWLVKKMAVLAALRFVSAVMGAVRSTARRRDLAVVAGSAFRPYLSGAVQMRVVLEDSALAWRLAVVAVVLLLVLRQCWMYDMKAQILDLPVIAQTERLQPALPVEQRRGSVVVLQVIELLGLDPAMVELAVWFAVAAAVAVAVAAVVVAAAAIALVAVDLFVPYNAEPILSSHLQGCLHQYQQTPSAPCTEEHRPATTLGALSARSSAALALISLASFALPPVFADLPRTLPAANSALTRLRPAIAKEQREAVLTANYLRVVHALGLVRS